MGFKFVGPTIIYSFMEASGMVNDHLVGCYGQLKGREILRSRPFNLIYY